MYPARVAVYGDSLAQQAQPYFERLMAAEDTSNTTFYSSHGGTALCDWLGRMRTMARTTHFEAVMLEFSGNALTRCMADVALLHAGVLRQVPGRHHGGDRHLGPDRCPRLPDRRSRHPQQQESVPDWDALDLQYAQIAAADPGHVTFVDAGPAVEGPGGTYVQTLPCYIGEPCTGPVVDGVRSNVVRSADGVHFCPVAEVRESCRAYSAGCLPVRRRHGARLGDRSRPGRRGRRRARRDERRPRRGGPLASIHR